MSGRAFVRRLAASWTGRSALEKLALEGAAWTFVAFGAAQVLRLAGNLVTTRLLYPELFGLMAIVQAVIAALAMFSDVGLTINVVRHERGGDPDFLRTVFTVQALRGLGLWILCILLAPFVAGFYADQRIVWLLALVGFTSVLNGLSSTSLLVLRRRIAVRQLTLLELGSQALGISVMVLWAAIDPSIAALAAGPIASSIFMLVAGHLLNRPNVDRFSMDRNVIRELISFGKWIFVSTVFTFLASQSDRLLLGKLVSLQFLGVYNIGFMLADVPRALWSALSWKVLFPSLARFKDAPHHELRRKVGRHRPTMLAGGAAAICLLTGCGDLLVASLYDERWSAARWMLPLLALGVWPSMLTWTIDPIFYVLGKPHFPAIGAAGKFFSLLLLTTCGALAGGAAGAVAGVALSSVSQYVVSLFFARRQGVAFPMQDLVATVLLLGSIGLLFAVRSAAGSPSALLLLFNLMRFGTA